MARVRFERAHEYSWWGAGHEGCVLVDPLCDTTCTVKLTRDGELEARQPLVVHHDELEVVIAALINYKKYTEANENEDPSDE